MYKRIYYSHKGNNILIWAKIASSGKLSILAIINLVSSTLLRFLFTIHQCIVHFYSILTNASYFLHQLLYFSYKDAINGDLLIH